MTRARTRRTSTPSVVAAAAIAMLLAATTEAADSPAVRCEREIAKRAARFAQAKMRAMQICEDGILQGKSAGPCPDAKADRTIAAAASKLASATARRCGGDDRA